MFLSILSKIIIGFIIIVVVICQVILLIYWAKCIYQYMNDKKKRSLLYEDPCDIIYDLHCIIPSNEVNQTIIGAYADKLKSEVDRDITEWVGIKNDIDNNDTHYINEIIFEYDDEFEDDDFYNDDYDDDTY